MTELVSIIAEEQNPAIGDIVYYESPTAEYTMKRGRVVELRMRKLSGQPLIEVTDKIVMDNGDVVNGGIVFPTKEEANNYLLSCVTSSLGRARITLANTQSRIEKLERIQRKLQKSSSSY